MGEMRVGWDWEAVKEISRRGGCHVLGSVLKGLERRGRNI